ncbi:sensor histidine kinase [Arcobacter arenosus]|uniref:Histidine kinase n=1 Tax=Arcobacter arenosus TaxID=2576037 RepID=A0A5R8Y099_9BACT|nr:histidine kinase [Arcobacter arenosus]TLP37503.1 histidine kinase [Arcobacter arenosus]
MDRIKLKISKKDWLYIVFIGTSFGFLISWFFYFLNEEFKNIYTVLFSSLTAFCISLFSFVFITISNDFILPKLKEKFWYLISFIFSFLSGFLGFSFSFYLGSFFKIEIVEFISAYWFFISIIIGFLTFLIGLILHQFVSMKHRYENINSQVLETKIKALENELNPHFLFNALNSISELIYVDKKDAERATLELSRFLRNAITKESLIPIKTEIEMVKTYLNIENIRFENNIELNVELNEDDENILVPKFSIQLLVENAIKHGYNRNRLKIDILVSSKEIIIINNGKLSQRIKYGTGLNNLDKRLDLLNVGRLSHQVDGSNMKFIISLKD